MQLLSTVDWSVLPTNSSAFRNLDRIFTISSFYSSFCLPCSHSRSKLLFIWLLLIKQLVKRLQLKTDWHIKKNLELVLSFMLWVFLSGDAFLNKLTSLVFASYNSRICAKVKLVWMIGPMKMPTRKTNRSNVPAISMNNYKNE